MISAATLAELFNLTEQRVCQLVKEGIIPKAGRGKYELVAAVQGYVKYLQERAYGRIESVGVHEHRARLVAAQANKTEFEVASLERTLLPFNEVVTSWQQLVTAFRSKCLALPSKLAVRLEGVNAISEIEDHIGAGVREALEELSRFELGHGDPARDPDGRDPRKASAKAYAKRVGGRARRIIA